MRIRVQVLIESDQEATPLRLEEVACFERDRLSQETLGLQLEEAKQMLAGVQQVITESQVEEYVEQQRQCPRSSLARDTITLVCAPSSAN